MTYFERKIIHEYWLRAPEIPKYTGDLRSCHNFTLVRAATALRCEIQLPAESAVTAVIGCYGCLTSRFSVTY